MSTAQQLAGTIANYFAGQTDLICLAVDLAALPDVRWEAARDEALFPHVYSALPRTAVRVVEPPVPR